MKSLLAAIALLALSAGALADGISAPIAIPTTGEAYSYPPTAGSTPPSGPTIADVTHAGSLSTASPISGTVTAAVSAGTLVVVCIYDGHTAFGTGVTDSESNTYTQVKLQQAATQSLFVAMYYSFITTSLTTSDTITYTPAATAAGAGFNAISAKNSVGGNYVSNDTAVTKSADNFSSAYSVTGGVAGSSGETNFGCGNSFSTMANAASPWVQAPSVYPSPNPTQEVFQYRVNAGTSGLVFNGTVNSQWWTVVIGAFE